MVRFLIKWLLVRIAPLGARQKNTRYAGARRRLYQKNSKRDTIKVFKPIVKRKEKNMVQKVLLSCSCFNWLYFYTFSSFLCENRKFSHLFSILKQHLSITSIISFCVKSLFNSIFGGNTFSKLLFYHRFWAFNTDY